MGMNFPNSPLPGEVYTPVGGYSYVFLDGVWRVVQNPQDYVTTTAETRNRIVNGAMQISQEWGDTTQTTNGYYGADQWRTGRQGTATITTQRVQVTTPNGSRNRYRATVTVADTTMATGEYVYLRQDIEGIRVADFRYGTAQARQSILRFGFKAPAGTYSTALRNDAGDRSYIVNFTISTGQANTDTEQIFIIPGDTTGVWDVGTGMGIQLNIYPAGGPQLLGVAGWQAGAFGITSGNTNGVATAGNVFELFDAGLYLDPLATGVPPRWQMPDEAEELRACQRYWEESGPHGTYFAGNTTTGLAYGTSARWRTNKRTTPTITGVSNTNQNFPTTATYGSSGADGWWENRTCNVTGNGSYFRSTVTGNARM